VTFTPTLEQQAAVEAAVSNSDNLIIEARAGAAKTSTLVLIAEAILARDAPAQLHKLGWRENDQLGGWWRDDDDPLITLAETYKLAGLPATLRCLAFNKANADEMVKRLPPNCLSQTLNSLGHRAWGEFLRKRLKLDKGKLYALLQEEIKLLDKPDQQEISELFAETLDAIRAAKVEGWVPEVAKGYWKPLCSDEDFFASLDFEPTELQRYLITKVSKRSWDMTLRGEIDFDDQILTAAICPVTFEFYPTVLIDEAQDLSPINHIILGKLCKRSRLIAVGDPCQAIYGFRGAAGDSMDLIQRQFSCRVVYLTTTFRCARSIVAAANWRAPDMRAADWAGEGTVETITPWSFANILDGDAIVCRNNAPLFSLALRMIGAGRLPELSGRDFTKGLITALRKLGEPKTLQPEVLDAIDRWQAKELERSRRKSQVYDKAECLRVFARQATTLEEACSKAEEVLHREGRIALMTGHKSKGLEFDRVFILNKSLIKMRDQDPNVLYVMQTRARHYLGYIELAEFAEAEE
jgi:superfamily I DNA/RNA helicase